MDTDQTPRTPADLRTGTGTDDDPFRAVESELGVLLRRSHAMSRQLARLDELGLIERRADPDDSRGQLIRLTAEGTRQSEDVRAAGRAFLRRALRSWSDEDPARLAGYLARLNVDLGAPPDVD